MGKLTTYVRPGMILQAAGTPEISDHTCSSVGPSTFQSTRIVTVYYERSTVCRGCRFGPFTFSETKPQMVPMDLNIGFQGLALIQGQIYNPDYLSYLRLDGATSHIVYGLLNGFEMMSEPPSLFELIHLGCFLFKYPNTNWDVTWLAEAVK